MRKHTNAYANIAFNTQQHTHLTVGFVDETQSTICVTKK